MKHHLLKILMVGMASWAAPLHAQMKSVDFPDTMRFEPLQIPQRASKVPRKLPAFHYRLSALLQEDQTILSNDGHQMAFTFWMPIGKKWTAFQLNACLQFNDKVTISADEVKLGGGIYYQIEFWGEADKGKGPGGGVAECATVYWIDLQTMKAIDFTRYRNESWPDGKDDEGGTIYSNATEEATLRIEGDRILIDLDRQRFTPEPYYHNAMYHWTYIFRQEPMGWIKESESTD